MTERQPQEAAGNHSARFCGAKTRSGGTCRQRAMDGKRRCYLHGGKTPGGIASPHFKHGRFSKALPGGYREAYEAALNDPDLLNLTDTIAVLVARQGDLILSLNGNGVNPEIQAAWRAFRSAQDRKDRAGLMEAADRLESLILDHAAEAGIWEEIRVVSKDVAALSRQEQARRESMQSMVPVSQVMNFARDVLLLVRQNVTDPASWARVQAGVTELVGRDHAIANALEAEDAQC